MLERFFERMTAYTLFVVAWAVVLASVAAMLGCASTIHVDSEPPGALITYKGEAVGRAPLDFTVWDEFGWFSTYIIGASLAGYAPAVQLWQEPSPGFAQYIIPPVVTFKLTKQ